MVFELQSLLPFVGSQFVYVQFEFFFEFVTLPFKTGLGVP